MKTIALRLYGKNDIRLESFELPEITDGDIAMEITSNSICMSTYKIVLQGTDHKRVPDNIAQNPVILGHEFCGKIIEIGKKWKDKFSVGTMCTVSPMIGYPGRELDAVGHTFPNTGGHATKIIIPSEVIEMDCLLAFDGKGCFKASLAEPISCIIGAFNTQYHYRHGTYKHDLGIIKNGAMAILGGGGPMGLAAITYTLQRDIRPSRLVVTDIHKERLEKAASIITVKDAEERGVKLHYIDTSTEDGVEKLLELNGGVQYDDIFVFAPAEKLVEEASDLLAHNGCLNFFAGPHKRDFSAKINFYDIHYSGHHVVGSSGGNASDLRDALEIIGNGKMNPALLITHVGGLDSAKKTIMNLPDVKGGKKIIYTGISMPLTAISEFEELGEKSDFFAKLSDICKNNRGLWSVNAEKYLLKNGKKIEL